ncbi:MAG: DinB family protein [Aureliella sp.]
MAVRYWPGGTVSLETHWGHRIAIVSGEDDEATDRQEFAFAGDETYDHVVTRLPNEAKAKMLPADKAPKDANAVRVRTLAWGASVVTADGVTILVVDLSNPPTDGLPAQVDLAILHGDVDVEIASGIAEATRQVEATRIMLCGAMDNAAERVLAEVTSIKRVPHNTLALVSGEKAADKPQLVILSEKPWEMPEDLAREFAAMEKSCADSQQVFAKLSVDQMNFKPENGTHTPRWNAEHMMGRQLLFFSQIYHSVDQRLPIIDLNPKQMPPDYRFAHPDWTGAEEARQMQRVSEYTRRFAYLLNGKQLSDKATGTFWPSVGALIRQMQRHYGEHTSNTEKKFDLPGFPKA